MVISTHAFSEMTGHRPRAFRCDLFCDASKNNAVESHEYREDNDPAIETSKILSWTVVLSFANVHLWLFMHDRVNQGEVGFTVSNFQNGGRWEPCGRWRVSPTQTKIFLNLNRKAIFLRTVMILITRLGSDTVICQSRLC